MVKNILMTVLVMLLVLMMMSVSVNAATTIEGFSSLNEGDHLSFTMTLDIGDNPYTDNASTELSDYTYKVIGSEKVPYNGTDVDCYIIEVTVDMTTSISMSMMGITVNTEMTMTQDHKMWVDKDGGVVMKEQETSYSYTSITYENNSSPEYLKDSETEETSSSNTTYELVPDAPPYPLAVGSTWTEKARSTVVSEERTRSREPGDEWGNWDTSTDTFTDDTTMEMTVVSEEKLTVPAGTFDTLKIRSRANDEDDYTLDYKDAHGMLVKFESRDSDDEVTMSAELNSYRYGSSGSDDGSGGVLSFLPGFGLLSVLAAVTVGRVLVRKRS